MCAEWHHARRISNSLAHWQPVSGAQVAYASRVTDTSGGQCSALLGCLVESVFITENLANQISNLLPLSPQFIQVELTFEY